MIHRKPSPFVLPLVALLVFACDAAERDFSDLEQWEVALGLPDRWFGIDRPSHVLVGSRLDPDVVGVRDESGEYDRIEPELDACVHLFGNGTVEWIDDPDAAGEHARVTAAGPGSVGISAPREACPDYSGPGEDFVRDEWSVVGVEPSATIGEWGNYYDHQALMVGSSGPSAFPTEFGQALGPVQVAEGGMFKLDPVLMRWVDDERFEVRHARPDVGLAVPEGYEALALDPDGSSQFQLAGELAAGQRLEAQVMIGADDVALPGVDAVPAEAIASLELVAVYEPDTTGDRDWGPPIGVMALAHDAEGRRILGAPIQWSIQQGLLGLEPAEDASDLLWVTDTCRDRPLVRDHRDATLEARVGEVVASVELEWTAFRTENLDVDPESPTCQGSACDCSATATPSSSLAALLGLLLLGVGLRRGRS
jgi:MYXO-CTERM domain-containing protein